MELRRALLLFAIVLGLAAVVTSLSNSSRTPAGRSGPPPPTGTPAAHPGSAPTARPGSAPGGAREITFDQSRAPATRRLVEGRSATVTVKVDESGSVELEGLGLRAEAEALTPARFDLLPSRAGRHAVRFTAAGAARASTVGVLAVQPDR